MSLIWCWDLPWISWVVWPIDIIWVVGAISTTYCIVRPMNYSDYHQRSNLLGELLGNQLRTSHSGSIWQSSYDHPPLSNPHPSRHLGNSQLCQGRTVYQKWDPWRTIHHIHYYQSTFNNSITKHTLNGVNTAVSSSITISNIFQNWLNWSSGYNTYLF